jgi:hypothetical protein
MSSNIPSQHHKKREKEEKKVSMGWGCSTVVQSLPNMHEDISLVSSATEKNKDLQLKSRSRVAQSIIS